MKRFAVLMSMLLLPLLARASEGAERPDLTGNWVGIVSVLLAAMTFVNAMDERNVFEALRFWLIRKGFGYRALFLGDRPAGLFHLAVRRQPDHRAVDGGGDGGRRRQPTARRLKNCGAPCR